MSDLSVCVCVLCVERKKKGLEETEELFDGVKIMVDVGGDDGR